MRSGSSFVETREEGASRCAFRYATSLAPTPPPTPVLFAFLRLLIASQISKYRPIGLQRFQDEVDNLQYRKWRYIN